MSGRPRVDAWRRVFEGVYGRGEVPGGTFDDRGWIDRITGRPFSAAVLEEWLAETVALVMSLRPRRVLEVGAGTGNVALAVAPAVDHYLATDVSPTAVAQLLERAAAAGIKNVETRVAEAADAVSGADGIDTIVLNSVCQYLGDERRAAEVLHAAAAAVGPGGWVHVGDVRHAGLAAEETRRAAAVTGKWVPDEEVTLLPSFFTALADAVGRTAVVLLKPARHPSSLTSYRFDVVIGPVPRPATPVAVERWPLGAPLDVRRAEPAVVLGVPTEAARALDPARARLLPRDDAIAGIVDVVLLGPADHRELDASGALRSAARARTEVTA